MTAYYNEFDPYAAQWLRNLSQAGHIAPGIVDERSIEDVTPADLAGFTQCHFFAGVGVWSLALRKAGWPDDRPVWTGSCPCQPFSAAGAGAGFADPRHLWPSFAWLIGQCRPPVVFGEQVASKAVEPWVDLVHADLEALEYAFGAVPFPSAGVGAPHIRDRLFWVADADHEGLEGRRESRRERGAERPVGSGVLASGVADPYGRNASAEREQCSGQQRQQPQDGSAIHLANAESCGRGEERQNAGRFSVGDNAERRTAGFKHGSGDMRAGPVNGFWRNADWLGCRDDKWRPVEPGTFPLANGATSRVGRLRAYGNAINAEAAHEFIAAYLA
ncbi:C-5 cytosine-specific DNA methylase [compost metagenome]